MQGIIALKVVLGRIQEVTEEGGRKGRMMGSGHERARERAR
jgi:hypothetical protein